MNILTFDIEDWYHLLDHKSTKSESDWAAYAPRITQNTDRILELLSSRGLTATFFCLGWVGEHHPDVVRRIDALGHEVATHSHLHQLAYEQSSEEFRQDLVRSVRTLEDLTGKKVRAYRAPGFSATRENPWLFEILCECGIDIDCSLFPAQGSHGGFPGLQAQPAWVEVGGMRIKEYPMSTARVLGRDLVFSGGGYFRLFPYWMIKRLMAASAYVMTYLHPRDFDADQPIIEDLSSVRKFKSYYGLSSAFDKFSKLIDDFEFLDLKAADERIDWEHAPVVKIDDASMANPGRKRQVG
jgi:polysaccharide deacetylase family protein (PEP-CTERM system associated)